MQVETTFKFSFPSQLVYYSSPRYFFNEERYPVPDSWLQYPMHYLFYAQISEAQYYMSKFASNIGIAIIQKQKIALRSDKLKEYVQRQVPIYEKNAIQALQNKQDDVAREWIEKKHLLIDEQTCWQAMTEQSQEIERRLLIQYEQAKERYEKIIQRFVSVIHLERFDYEYDTLLGQLRQYACLPNFSKYSIQMYCFLAQMDFKELSYLFNQ